MQRKIKHFSLLCAFTFTVMQNNNSNNNNKKKVYILALADHSAYNAIGPKL